MKVLNKKQLYDEERIVQSEWAKRDFEKEVMIEDLYQSSIDNIQKKIDVFYLTYAGENGMTLAQAKKRAKKDEVNKVLREAKSTTAINDLLGAYHIRGNRSRLDLLRVELDVELRKMYAKQYEIMNEYILTETQDELERQSKLLGKEPSNMKDKAIIIVGAVFIGKTFGERIKLHYKDARRGLEGSVNRIYSNMSIYQSKRKDLFKAFRTYTNEALRLLRTEVARTRTQAEHTTAKEQEASHYVYITEMGACSICEDLSGLAFKVEDAIAGVNHPLMHPNCRCSTRPHTIVRNEDGSTSLDEFEVIDDFDNWNESRNEDA